MATMEFHFYSKALKRVTAVNVILPEVHKKKPGIGNALMFGIGGIFVEALNEVSFTACPINLAGLEKLLSSTKATKLMEASRGFKAVDRQRLAEIFIRLSQLVEDHKEIVELDLNPLIADKEGRLIAIDARIVLNI